MHITSPGIPFMPMETALYLLLFSQIEEENSVLCRNSTNHLALFSVEHLDAWELSGAYVCGG